VISLNTISDITPISSVILQDVKLRNLAPLVPPSGSG